MDTQHNDGEPIVGTPLYRLNEVVAKNPDARQVEVLSGDVIDICSVCDADDKDIKAIREKAETTKPGELWRPGAPIVLPAASVLRLITSATKPTAKTEAA